MSDYECRYDTIESLALMYMQHQDLSGKTPAEIETMYHDAYKEMVKSAQDRSIKPQYV